MRRALSSTIMVICIAGSIAGVYNVYADNKPVEEMARGIACGGDASANAKGHACRFQMTRLARTPFWQDITFHGGGKNVEIRCQRAYYLVGEYACRAR